VTVVDAKEFFEYTPGVLRCFVKPAHFDSLSFTLQPVLERSMGVKYIWGEVKKLEPRFAHVKPMFADQTDKINFDYCIICAGCNFGPFANWGESLWFPTIHEEAHKVSMWKHIDERFIEGRRRHILEEYHKLNDLNNKAAELLVVGAGFIGVEWVTEMNHYFPKLQLTIIDFLPRCLGPLPDSAADYCSEYMHSVGIKEFYNQKYNKDDPAFWTGIGYKEKLPDNQIYVCIGVKSSNYFMPEETKSLKGPGGGGWIHFNWNLQVTERPEPGAAIGKTWADGRIYAVGDCNYGCIGNPGAFELQPIPKISYPGEEQALHACKNVVKMSKAGFNENGTSRAKLMETWWPWGAGMFATSLGPHDACFVMAANHNKGSGYMVNWWIPAALQKEIIETSKVNECNDGILGKLIWYFVHHTPFHLWGEGHRTLLTCCKCNKRDVLPHTPAISGK